MKAAALALLAAAFVLPRAARADEPLPPAPAPLFAEAAPPPVPAGRSVTVHVDASRPVTLEWLSPDEVRWRPVCVAPCDVAVPFDGVYRVTDRGMIPSQEIELEGAPGDRVTLDVSARTYDQHTTGRRLTITGYIAGAVGLGLEIGAIATSSTTAQEALIWSGVGVAAVAIACTITAWVLLEPTGVSQSHSTPERRAQGDVPWTRAPMWRTVEAGPAFLPQAANVPIFTRSF